MRRAYKFLLRPTVRQQQALTEMLRDHCSLYNAALEERRTAWKTRRATVRYDMQSAQLSAIRAFDPEGQGRWSFSSQQSTLRRLNRAFVAFFKRAQAGQKPGYPRFKGSGHFDLVTFPEDGDGCRWNSMPHHPQPRVRLQGVGHVRVHAHRPVQGRVKTISVKREGRRWYVILSCDGVPVEPLPSTGAVIGIDMGVASFLTTSDGDHIANPQCLVKAADELAEAQRAVAKFPRCKAADRGARHRRAVEKVAKVHRKIRRQRRDHAHKAALALVRDHDLIAHEALRITNMTKSPKPKPGPGEPGKFLPNGSAAKAGLNKAILDAGWGVFLSILTAKAESAGRMVVAVEPRNTSRRCPECGHVAEENRRTQAKFECIRCGHAAHADLVGALNVLRAGLALCSAA